MALQVQRKNCELHRDRKDKIPTLLEPTTHTKGAKGAPEVRGRSGLLGRPFYRFLSVLLSAPPLLCEWSGWSPHLSGLPSQEQEAGPLKGSHT